MASRSQHPLVGFGTYKIGFVPASSNTAGEWIHAQAQAHAHTKTYLHMCTQYKSEESVYLCGHVARPTRACTGSGPERDHQRCNRYGIQVNVSFRGLYEHMHTLVHLLIYPHAITNANKHPHRHITPGISAYLYACMRACVHA